MLRALIILALATMALHAQPCNTEDSDTCTWYAGSQGNGNGRSFTATVYGVIYW